MQTNQHIAGETKTPMQGKGSVPSNAERVPAESPQTVIILNADDWGLNQPTTSRILDCVRAGALSSVSAMVFMDVSESAAATAREHAIDAGLHLNLTTASTGSQVSSALREHHARVIGYLRARKYHRVLFNPLLMNSFDYVVKAQVAEFTRLYGSLPRHLDGHHHMHLCANVLLAGLLPPGASVRRSKSWLPGEKGTAERMYRRLQTRFLNRRHRTTDYFFDLAPLDLDRLKKIAALAQNSDVEVSAHPEDEQEYRFLLNGGLARCLDNVTLAHGYHLRDRRTKLGAQIAEAGPRDAAIGADRP